MNEADFFCKNLLQDQIKVQNNEYEKLQNEQQQVLDLTNVEEYDDDEDEGGPSVVEITPLFQPVNANLALSSQQTQQPNPVQLVYGRDKKNYLNIFLAK